MNSVLRGQLESRKNMNASHSCGGADCIHSTYVIVVRDGQDRDIEFLRLVQQRADIACLVEPRWLAPIRDRVVMRVDLQRALVELGACREIQRCRNRIFATQCSLLTLVRCSRRAFMVRCRSTPKHEVSRRLARVLYRSGNADSSKRRHAGGQIGHAGKASRFRSGGLGGALTRNKELQGQDAFLDIPTSVRK